MGRCVGISQIARNLKGRVCEKEDRQAHVVLIGRHPKILLETLNFGIANVSALVATSASWGVCYQKVLKWSGRHTVEERKQVEERQHRNQADIHLGVESVSEYVCARQFETFEIIGH